MEFPLRALARFLTHVEVDTVHCPRCDHSFTPEGVVQRQAKRLRRALDQVVSALKDMERN